MTERISFKTSDGRDASGELALPPGTVKRGAVVLLQEWWGVNDHIRALVDRLAAAGFVVLAPDLYEGRTTTDPDVARQYAMEMKWAASFEIIRGAMEVLKDHPRSNGNLGITGFCLGGAGTLLAASSLPGLKAAVAFYGIPPSDKVAWETAETVPIQGHYALRDDHVKSSRAEEIAQIVQGRGRIFEVFTYNAEHAFVNDSRPVFHPASAMLAWSRMIGFFRDHLD